MGVKPTTIVLGSFAAISGGFGLYWAIQKLRARYLTLTVTPTAGTACETLFTLRGRYTDGFGRGIANAQITIVFNEGTGVEAKTVVVTGPDGSYSYTFGFGTGGRHIDTDVIGARQTIRAYTPQATSPIVTVTVDAPACTQC
ncbi:MAG: hypothetical protein QXH03_02780 [Candidatus Bathyarchaeia archaeon]